MPKVVITHQVKDVNVWAAKPHIDVLQKGFGTFATDIVAYVAVDGSNQVAISANVHDVDKWFAFAQSPEAIANKESSGVIPTTIVRHFEADREA